MGACAGSTKKQPKSKTSGSISTCQDSPVKRQNKLSTDNNEKQQYKLSQDIDPYYAKFQIHEADFKQHASLKSQSYYMIFYKFKMLSDQIGDIQQQGISSRLTKSLAKIKLLREKIKRDFNTDSYSKASPTLPILNEEILIYTFKYTQFMIDVFDQLEKDPKYEELYPIISFSFKEMKNKLRDILIDADQVRVNSQGKHRRSEEVPPQSSLKNIDS
ncbi:hypothetical protein ABPG74_012787 [Tetrahymena malaccensis]